MIVKIRRLNLLRFIFLFLCENRLHIYSISVIFISIYDKVKAQNYLSFSPALCPKHCAGGDCVDVRLQAVGDMFLPLTYFYKINSQTKRSLQHLITAENSAKVRTKKEWLFEFKTFCRRIGQPNLKK